MINLSNALQGAEKAAIVQTDVVMVISKTIIVYSRKTVNQICKIRAQQTKRPNKELFSRQLTSLQENKITMKKSQNCAKVLSQSK